MCERSAKGVSLSPILHLDTLNACVSTGGSKKEISISICEYVECLTSELYEREKTNAACWWWRIHKDLKRLWRFTGGCRILERAQPNDHSTTIHPFYIYLNPKQGYGGWWYMSQHSQDQRQEDTQGRSPVMSTCEHTNSSYIHTHNQLQLVGTRTSGLQSTIRDCQKEKKQKSIWHVTTLGMI